MIKIPAPMLATDGGRPFTSGAWAYEVKYDGYRCLAAVEGGQVRLSTKNQKDCTRAYPEVVAALRKIPGGPHVIDGEACTLVEGGVSDFNLFHGKRGTRKPGPGAPPVTLCAFDLLVHDGQEIMGLPLEARKGRLEQLLARVPKVAVLFVGMLPADADLFAAIVGAQLPIEGVVAKRLGSVYTPGARSPDWVKIKRPGWNAGRKWKSS
jgi:bifunctional non-homologous end joining protein LigD